MQNMIQLKNINLVTVLGATATGKTAFASHLAAVTNGEIISADSRQVYKGMDLGTGKDYKDYIIEGRQIPYHLIDILDAGEEYNVFEYQKDFNKVFAEIQGRNKLPVLCGGTGLYIESVLKNYSLIRVPQNPELRKNLESKSIEELVGILSSYRKLHNTTDSLIVKRLIRAIEIEEYYSIHAPDEIQSSSIFPVIFGIRYPRDLRRQRITDRLKQRLSSGLVEEVEMLMAQGVSSEKLLYYGLEYKYLAMYLNGMLNKDEMFTRLNTAIHQFAKRQMTWFRKMEREGTIIYWLDGELSMQEKIEMSLQYIKSFPLTTNH